MSFSSLQKEEITRQTPRQLCCKRAFLGGVFATRAILEDEKTVISLDNSANAQYLSELISEQYGKAPDIYTSRFGGRRVFVSFSSPAVYKKLNSFSSFSAFFDKKCGACEGAFLRGIFFAAGKLSDPEKQYSLEFSPSARASELAEYFESVGLSPKVTVRGDLPLVYFRKSTDIEDFLANAAMNNAVFELMNIKIKHDIRNNVNRVVNCETNNLGRAGQASDKSVRLIGALMENELLSSLPEELETTAKLRYSNPELSLSRLAALHTPPISKPGLSHRLKRIEEIAEELLKKDV